MSKQGFPAMHTTSPYGLRFVQTEIVSVGCLLVDSGQVFILD